MALEVHAQDALTGGSESPRVPHPALPGLGWHLPGYEFPRRPLRGNQLHIGAGSNSLGNSLLLPTLPLQNRSVALGAAPVEGDVLAGLAVPLEVPSKGFCPVGGCSTPRSYGAGWTHLAARRVKQLHPLPLRRRRTG